MHKLIVKERGYIIYIEIPYILNLIERHKEIDTCIKYAKHWFSVLL